MCRVAEFTKSRAGNAEKEVDHLRSAFKSTTKQRDEWAARVAQFQLEASKRNQDQEKVDVLLEAIEVACRPFRAGRKRAGSALSPSIPKQDNGRGISQVDSAVGDAAAPGPSMGRLKDLKVVLKNVVADDEAEERATRKEARGALPVGSVEQHLLVVEKESTDTAGHGPKSKRKRAGSPVPLASYAAIHDRSMLQTDSLPTRSNKGLCKSVHKSVKY